MNSDRKIIWVCPKCQKEIICTHRISISNHKRVCIDGMKHSEARNKKLSFSKKNINNPNWKGDFVKKGALHEWVRNNINTEKICQFCGSKNNIDIANKTGKYLRDFDDWMWLCRKCHMRYDGTIKNLKQYHEKA